MDGLGSVVGKSKQVNGAFARLSKGNEEDARELCKELTPLNHPDGKYKQAIKLLKGEYVDRDAVQAKRIFIETVYDNINIKGQEAYIQEGLRNIWQKKNENTILDDKIYKRY